MSAYYNEIDPYAAQWLRNLMAAGHIAPGDVDERSIEDVKPDDLHGYTQCHFFAGIGVWSYALRGAGWPDSREVWTGSCPCQPFSAAGRGKGFTDERHLWPHFYCLTGQCRPPVIFGEQVAGRDGLRWLDLVQADMEGAGYATAAVDICAAGVGAPHIRQRLFWVAHTGSKGLQGCQPDRGHCGPQGWPPPHGHTGAGGLAGKTGGFWQEADWLHCRDGKLRPAEPGTFPLADGVAARVGRLRTCGNAVNAEVAKTFIRACLAG